MRTSNEVLIAFFESKREALGGLALVDAAPARRGRRNGAVLLSKAADGTCESYEPPAPVPLGGIIGLGLGGILGSCGGEAGVVVGLSFGLYAGLFVDAWRTLDRCDLLDEIQTGLAPGRAAVVSFVRDSSATRIERCLATTGAVTVHRFPGTPIEEDVAREAAEAAAELGRLVQAVDAGASGSSDREQRIAAGRRSLSILEDVANRLLWLERIQFEFETGILERELEGSRRWQGLRLRRRITDVGASHRRSSTTLEASRAHLRAAEALVEATAGSAARGPVFPHGRSA